MAKVELEWDDNGSVTYGPFRATVYTVPGVPYYFLSVSFATVQIYNGGGQTEDQAKARAEQYIAKHIAAIQALGRIEE